MNHRLISSRPIIVGTSIAAVFWCAALAAQTAASSFKRIPGSWQVFVVIEKLEGDGITEQTRQMMQTMLDKQSEAAFCLSPDKAKQEDFVGTIINSAKNQNCKNVREDIIANTTNIVAQCTDASGKTFSMAMEGNYNPTRVEMTIKSENAPSRNGPITMTMRTVTKRVGECTKGQKEI
jgi:Protein of unknown function (DUF3617)